MKANNREPTADDLARVLSRIFEIMLTRDQTERAMRPPVSEDDAEYALYEVVWSDPETDPDGADERFELRSVIEAEHAIDTWKDRLSRNDTGAVAADLDAALSTEGLTLDKADPRYRILLHQGTRVALRAAERILDREHGLFAEDDPADWVTQIAAAPVPPPPVREVAPSPPNPPASAPVKRDIPLLSVSFEAMRQSKIGTDWSTGGKDHRDSENAIRAFLELMDGDRRLDEVSSDDAFLFRTKLARVPSTNGKGVFAGLSYKDAVARADAIDQGEYEPPKGKTLPPQPVKRLAAKTINKYLTYFTTLYHHRPVAALQVGTPFGGTLIGARVRARQNSRRPWSATDLASLVASPLYRGSAGPTPARRAVAGSEVIQDGLFWAPLLTLFAGLRLEELCGLTADDIVQRGDFWCIEVRPNTVRPLLKSASATRTIPIHAQLIELKFVEYAKRHKRKIFPECVPGGPEKKLGYRLSRHFTDYRRRVGLTEESIDHHAFRHNFADAMLNAGVSTSIVGYLLGHAPTSVTDHDYHGRGASDRFDMRILHSAIAKVRHDGLESLLSPAV